MTDQGSKCQGEVKLGKSKEEQGSGMLEFALGRACALGHDRPQGTGDGEQCADDGSGRGGLAEEQPATREREHNGVLVDDAEAHRGQATKGRCHEKLSCCAEEAAQSEQEPLSRRRCNPVYIGQGEEIGTRIEEHDGKKDFWDWGYAFVSSGNALNRAHITWLEHALIDRATKAGRCHLDNDKHPKEPGLSESERADTLGFLREMLRILPLLGVRVFEKPTAVVSPGDSASPGPVENHEDIRDTVVVPAQQPGFDDVFLGKKCWYAIRIGGGMLPKIKYIAAYQTNPVSAITYYAKMDHIEPYGDEGKYKVVFAEPAQALAKPIPFADATTGAMQGPRYSSLAKLLSAKRVSDLFT